MNEALEQIKKMLGITDNSYDVMLTQILEASKADCKGSVIYRPYVTVAFFYMTFYAEVMRDRVGRGGLLSADEASFVNPLDIIEKAIPGYLRIDKALMCANQCVADPCFDPDKLLEDLKPEKDKKKRNTYGISYFVT